jgi:hypothetical protein
MSRVTITPPAPLTTQPKKREEKKQTASQFHEAALLGTLTSTSTDQFSAFPKT